MMQFYLQIPISIACFKCLLSDNRQHIMYHNFHFYVFCIQYCYGYYMISTIYFSEPAVSCFPYPDGIVAYMRKQAGPSAKELQTVEDVKKFLDSTEHSVIGRFLSLSLSLSHARMHARMHMQTYKYHV